MRAQREGERVEWSITNDFTALVWCRLADGDQKLVSFADRDQAELFVSYLPVWQGEAEPESEILDVVGTVVQEGLFGAN